MIPYVEPPTFEVLGRTIHAFGLLAFAAVLVGVGVMVARAPKIGFDREETLNLTVWTIAGGFVGSHLFSEIAYYPERVLADPLVLFRIWGTMSSFGGIAGGLAVAWWLLRREGKTPAEALRFVDGVAFAFPFSWIFGRAGCALAHDHVGIASRFFLAVRFPDGPRLDLGLLELLYTMPIAALFLALDRRPRPAGFWTGLFFVLYGPVRFLLDGLRVGEARYLGWTPSQYVCVAVTGAGAWLLARGRRPERVH